jgi:hypothetical protein
VGFVVIAGNVLLAWCGYHARWRMSLPPLQPVTYQARRRQRQQPFRRLRCFTAARRSRRRAPRWPP